MRRRLGRLLARVKGAVKRVWHRFFPPVRDDGAAIEPPEPPKLVRAYDGVEDAEYEEVRSSGIPPVARVDEGPRSVAAKPSEKKPVAPRPRSAVPTGAAPKPAPVASTTVDTVVADLLARVERFLSNEPPVAKDEDVTVVAAAPVRHEPAPVAAEPAAIADASPVAAPIQTLNEIAAEAPVVETQPERRGDEPQRDLARADAPEPVVEVAADEPAAVVEAAAAEPEPAVEVAADEPEAVVEAAAAEPEPAVETAAAELPLVVEPAADEPESVVIAEEPVRRVEIASASDSDAGDWHYETAPLAAISAEEPVAEAANEPSISEADVDQLLAPAPEPSPSDAPVVAFGVASISAEPPPDMDERAHPAAAREESLDEPISPRRSKRRREPIAPVRQEAELGDAPVAIEVEPVATLRNVDPAEAVATTVGETTTVDEASLQGVTSEPAEPFHDDDHRVSFDEAREEELELAAEPAPTEPSLVETSLAETSPVETSPAEPPPAEPLPLEGVESVAAAAPVDDDERAHADEAREEHVELTAHDFDLIAAAASVSVEAEAIAETAAEEAAIAEASEALEAASESEIAGEIDGEPASAEDVAVVAELDAAIAAAEAAATVRDELPQAPNGDSGETPPWAAAADDDIDALVPPAGFNPVPKVEIPGDYIPVAESVHQLYQLSLNGFEGPLDLLLFLIKRHSVDIFDIPVAFICERYLECIKVMENLDIDVAAEFLFMASELLQIKSRMLLPKPEGEGVEEEDIDPRAELVRRLLEYQKYKDAADRFGSLDRLNRDTFGREPEPIPVVTVGEAPLKEVGLFALVKAFEAVLKRQKPEVRHQVMLEQVSVRKRIRALLQMMESQEPLPFEALLEGHARKIDIVVTFLALLEMGKLKFLRIFQDEGGTIYVHPKFDDVSVAFQRLEGMDESQYAG